jgi:hypothetical protein
MRAHLQKSQIINNNEEKQIPIAASIKFFVLLLLLSNSFINAFSQQQITGRFGMGEPTIHLPGVNVMIKGT